MTHGLMIFDSLATAIRAGFQIYDRTERGYIVRMKTSAGWAMAGRRAQAVKWTLSDRGIELANGIVEWSRSPMNVDCRAEPTTDAERMAGYFRRQLSEGDEQLDLFGGGKP